MNFMEEEAVRFFSRFRETTSILREKLIFHHKTRFEKTCGSHARGLPKVLHTEWGRQDESCPPTVLPNMFLVNQATLW